MKKLFISAIALITTSCFAQNINFGIHGGLNLANANVETNAGFATLNFDSDLAVLFYLGGFAEIEIPGSEHALQSGLTFYRNGFDISENLASIQARISQLNVPLLFKYNVFDGVNINGGGYFGFVLDVEEEIEPLTIDATENYKTLDVGLSLGLEYNLPGGFLAEVRYNYGLVNLSDIDDVTINNRFFSIGAGYKF